MAAKPRVFESTPKLTAVSSRKLAGAVLSNRLTDTRQASLLKYAQSAQEAFMKSEIFQKLKQS